MDLDVVMRSNDCPYIVQFYGALFKEVSLLLSKKIENTFHVNQDFSPFLMLINLNSLHPWNKYNMPN